MRLRCLTKICGIVIFTGKRRRGRVNGDDSQAAQFNIRFSSKIVVGSWTSKFMSVSTITNTGGPRPPPVPPED
jgi:hypothetical protein